jgi:hypothetical protein
VALQERTMLAGSRRLHGDAQLAAADMPYGRGIQRSASATIAAIKPIAVNQDMAEISSSILVPIARSAASDRNRNLMQERRHRNIREIADSKFTQRGALHRRGNFLTSRRPVVEREHGGK